MRRKPLAGLLALLPAACGYTAGYDPLPGGVRTVAIEVVSNDTWWQRRELQLTRDLQTALVEHCAARPAAPGAADALLRVQIDDLRSTTLVTGQDPVLEGALRFQVTVRLVDRRSGRTLRERRILDQAEYRTSIGETQDSATREASADLARKIVLALEADF